MSLFVIPAIQPDHEGDNVQNKPDKSTELHKVHIHGIIPPSDVMERRKADWRITFLRKQGFTRGRTPAAVVGALLHPSFGGCKGIIAYSVDFVKACEEKDFNRSKIALRIMQSAQIYVPDIVKYREILLFIGKMLKFPPKSCIIDEEFCVKRSGFV